MKKLYDILDKIYAFLITASFFGGLLPLIPYAVALIIGGTTGEAIAVFLYDELYPWIIAMGSVAILVGLCCVYVKKLLQRKEKKNS